METLNLKILQVAAVDITIEKLLLPLIDASIQQGDIVDIACHNGAIATRLVSKGYSIHHIPFSRDLNVLSHMMNVFRMIKLFKIEKYDIVHTHTPIASIISRLAAKLAGVPTIIYTAHGFYFHENMRPLMYKLTYLLEKFWAIMFTDMIFFQSKEDYELALNNKFKVSDRLLHIGNGVSASLFNTSLDSRAYIRHQYGVGEEDIVLTFVGRLVIEKGIVELLQAFTSIKDRNKLVKLMLIGGCVDGDRDRISIESIRSRLPNSIVDDVILLGHRDDIPQLLSASDIFILPSYREGMPRSIIEAMAMGKPIIATDIRGCRELVIPGFNGHLCKVKDSKDLADKIQLLLDHPESIDQYGRHSKDMYMNEFIEAPVVARQLKVFDGYRKKESHYG